MEEQIYYEDEISLKELIMALLNNIKLICIVTLITVLLAGGHVFLILDEVYESSLEGTISVPESTLTRYGVYTFPTTESMDYLSMVKSDSVVAKTLFDLEIENGSTNGFANSITIESEKDSTRFIFKITGTSADDAVKRMNVLRDNYLSELKIYYKHNAINHFIKKFKIENINLMESRDDFKIKISQLEEEFSNMSPVITLQKLVSSDPLYAAKVARDRGIRVEQLNDEMMFEETINPHYEQLQGEIVELKKSILEIERVFASNETYLEELTNEKQAIDHFLETGDKNKINPEGVDVIGTKIQMAANPSYNESPIAPKKALTLAIALVLGGMLGVFAALFKEYWQNSAG